MPGIVRGRSNGQSVDKPRVWGALSGLEDKPYMKRADDKSIRMPVGAWFANVFRR
jgi:hypothetical protein